MTIPRLVVLFEIPRRTRPSMESVAAKLRQDGHTVLTVSADVPPDPGPAAAVASWIEGEIRDLDRAAASPPPGESKEGA